MKLIPLKGNSQKLDGGAMFGNAPKALWQRWANADDLNRIELSCRSLLIQYQEKNILLEVGIGAFFSPDLKDRYGVVESEHMLLAALAEHQLTHEDIDVVILSHLHFDHAGGLLSPYQDKVKAYLLFPNANIYVGKEQWERACKPNRRDRGSYIPELQTLLEHSGRLHLVERDDHAPFSEILSFRWSDGHTPGLMLTWVKTDMGPICYASDLIPGSPWVNLSITMGYDRYPELLIDEKTQLVEELEAAGGMIAFPHDAEIAIGKVIKDSKGKYTTQEVVL